MTGKKNGPDTKLECNICSKPYLRKGCLTNHLKNVHNIDNQAERDFIDGQLKQDETFIRETAQVETVKEFLQDI